MRSPLAMIGAIVVAVLLALLGLYFELTPHRHVVSYKALAVWGVAVVFLIGASFARPRAA